MRNLHCHFVPTKTRHGSQASHLSLTKDVLGIVATLGKVDDDNLGRLLSEYLGIDTMLAIVCKNYEGAKALELPYVGEFLANDPQKRLDLLKPRLPSGECPSGFLGFAVNMIHVDSTNLFCLTAMYKTRADMQLALPCISDGALSLDGGMVRATGVFSFGNREDVDVRFPKSSGMSNLPVNYFETENKIRETKWKKERLLEDIQREQALLDHTKFNFGIKKQEFVKFLAESSSYMTQHQIQAARDRLTPR
ncbi:hypothetical protein L1049_001653 [Liquidambar formosana]|uniref:Protein DEFECTIVE IN MERISTEM SILENCING 3 n=1 Tax=Liquidambar formosana TaxID=63359 RepID=A0AAP0N8V4_LIQFO